LLILDSFGEMNSCHHKVQRRITNADGTPNNWKTAIAY
jgi:hypothetical protein